MDDIHLCCILGGSNVPVANANPKSSESSAAAQRSTGVVPKAPTTQPPPVSSDSAAPATPTKGMFTHLGLLCSTRYME